MYIVKRFENKGFSMHCIPLFIAALVTIAKIVDNLNVHNR